MGIEAANRFWGCNQPKIYSHRQNFGNEKRFARRRYRKRFGTETKTKDYRHYGLSKKRILEIAIFGSWSSKKKKKVRQMSTKASNPRCKINFGNLTYRILILQTTWFWLFLQDLGTKSRFGFGTLILQTTWFTAYLHDFGTKSRFSFGTLILQTTWFTANLHDFGTKSRFIFWILILQTSPNHLVYSLFAWSWD